MSNDDLLYFEELEDSHPAPKRASPPSSAFSLSLLDGPLDFSVSADSRPVTGGHLLWLDSIPCLNAPILQPTLAPAPVASPMTPMVTPMMPMASPMIPGLPIVPRKEEPRKTSLFNLDPVYSPMPEKLSSIITPPVNLKPISPASTSPIPPPPSKPANTTLSTMTLPTPEASPPVHEQIALISVPAPVSSTIDVPPTPTSSRVDVSEIQEPELVPRSYQIQMYEKALNENTIAVMDTGSGKTLVAAMLIKKMIHREIMANRDHTQRKLCIFVVNNVPLVKQQASVIRTQSGAEVAELCGSSRTKKLVETLWAQISASTYVVVLTAQILLDVLRHGYWHMRRISLLVFDECHHARKDHPFCFIMNEFYHNKRTQDAAHKPRIFGMTASPSSDIGSKMNQSTSELERVLDSKVFSVQLHQLEGFVEKPMQIVALYNPPPKYNPTRLTLRMRRACGFEPKLLQTLNDVSTNLSQLGPWCVDHIWSLAVGNLGGTPKSTTSLDHLATVQRFILDTPFLPPTCNDENLTPKVQKLIQILRVTGNALKDEFCGIIFVQRRDTAAALTILLQELEEFHDLLRVEVLAGHSEGNHALLNMTLKEQDAIITRFRNKEYNLLVSTSVAEEGLDIQPCNIVIRFDPVTTTTSYMQSRGRARKKNSRYFMMQECNNHKDEATLEKIQYGEQSMRERYSNMPIEVTGEEDDQVQDKSTPEQQYLVPSTQALLTLGSAVPLLHRYCALLSTDEYCDQKPEFDVSASGASGFLCDLTLPPAAPIHFFQSDRTSTMNMARKSAAFKACEALHKLGAINDHLEPVIKNAESDDKDESTNQPKASQNRSYSRNTPLFWNPDPKQEPKRLFACTVTIAKDVFHHRHSYHNMCILTQQPLPFSDHNLNVFVKGKARQVIMRTSSANLQFSHDQIVLLRKFTLVLFQRMCRKDFNCKPDRMPYYIAPLTGIDNVDVSWDDVQMGQSTAVTPLDEQLLDEKAILDLVVMVKNDRSSDYFVHDIVRDSKMSVVMPPNRFKAEIESYGASQGDALLEPTFGDYFRWKFKQECAEDETILLVQKVRRMKNHLQPAPIDEKEHDDGALTLVPLSACRKSSVCASVLRVSQVIPSALFDLDSFLLVQEAQERVGLKDVQIDLLQVALTTSSANREYHYERLELLGDSFLKFSSTIRLFIVNPAKNEGQLHLNRTRIISNTALLKHAEQLELYRYISSTPFHRRHWHPIHFVVDGKPWDNRQQHMLSNKTMADVIEAALGAAFLSGGSIVAFHAAKLLRVPFDEFDNWEDFARVYQESLVIQDSTNSTSSIIFLSGEHQRHIDKVQKILGYTFKNPHLFTEAMTHGSMAHNSSCYERLEFLGDAVLDFQVIKYYYHKYRDAPPGAITLIKDASVNNQILGALSIQWGLGEFLIHNSEPLADEIQRAIATLEMQRESSPTNTLEGEYWVNVKMPKVLGDLVESTLGAVFVDCGFDFTVICDVFDRLIRPFLDDHINLEQIVIHPIKALMEFVQSAGCTEARFKREEHETENRSKSTMRRLGLGGRRGGLDANPTQVCKFTVHGELIATATGADMEKLRKQVAEEAMRKMQADPELMDGKCNCPKKRRAGHRTMLDKYHEGRFANGLLVPPLV